MDGSDFDGVGTGTGFDLQGRLILSAFSIGAGYLHTSHSVQGSSPDKLGIGGFFFEPRYSFEGDPKLRPYLTARVGFLTQSFTTPQGIGNFELTGPGTAVGAGGGIAFIMSPSLELNVSATYNQLSFGDVTINGQKQSDSDSHGSSISLRIGVGYVFGKR